MPVSNEIKNDVLHLSLSPDTLTCNHMYQEYQDKKFLAAEHYLNSLGVKTRTEYNNLLPSYLLLINIAEALKLKEVPEVTLESTMHRKEDIYE